MPILLALAAAAAAPQPGTLKTFRDWTVGCDNIRHCEAVALVPDAEDRDAYLMLVLARDGGAAAQATLDVPTGDAKGGTRLRLGVDGRTVADVTAPVNGQVRLVLTSTLARTLGNGTRLTLAGGKTPVGASLAGLAAALLYMDEQQGRLGTRGALNRPGPVPDRSAAPAPPRIVTPAPDARPPRALSVAVATRLIGADNATCEDAAGKVTVETHRLDRAHSLALVAHPCGNGAYNAFSSAYVLGESGRAVPARFDMGAGMTKLTNDDPVNADWDARTRRLNTLAKGRGLGDCGVSQSFAWDGTRFRLVEQRAMGECRGSTDYIRTWTADAVISGKSPHGHPRGGDDRHARRCNRG